MAKLPTICIVGATGTLGSELLTLLEESDLPTGDLRLFASSESAGEVYAVRHRECEVEVLEPGVFKDADIVVLAAPTEVFPAALADEVLASGARVIDAAGIFPHRDDALRVIPAVNGDRLVAGPRIISVPRGASTQVIRILSALRASSVPELHEIELVVSTVFQPVAGAGRGALEELWEQTVAVCNQREVPTNRFHYQLAFNAVPQVELILDSGSTRAEEEFSGDVRALLETPSLNVTSSFTRVPVFHGQAVSTYLEFARPVAVEPVLEALEQVEDFSVYRDPHDYPTPLVAAGTELLHIGRIRRTSSGGFWLWSVCDEVRWSAALNVLKILRAIVER